MAVCRITVVLWLALAWMLSPVAARPQTNAFADEIPIERCDVLPVVKLRIDSTDMRFLLDTAATTVLNIKTFSSGRSKQIQITSWSGTAATSAREVFLPELVLGSHHLSNVKLPAIDLSPIGKACGSPIDGILGVDLLDKMGVTIDLKRQVASLASSPADPKLLFDLMETHMHHCSDAFEQGNTAVLADCFDPDIVLYTPHGEFRGRAQVMEYLSQRYLKYAPNLCYKMTPRDVKTYGDALWYSYDYTLDSPKEHLVGHGMSMCRKDNGHWYILNLHNSLLKPDPPAKP